jgi:hypothetical protein
VFIHANLRLVVSIAKRYVDPTKDFFELVSDFSRGNKFSTYATWAIMKNFARTLYDENRYRDRFCTGYSGMIGMGSYSVLIFSQDKLGSWRICGKQGGRGRLPNSPPSLSPYN